MSRSENWNEEWTKFEDLNFFGRRMAKAERKMIFEILEKFEFQKESKIIDIGSGTGKNILHFRSLGYLSTVGIDISENSIMLCEKNGLVKNKDVFLMDALKMDFPDNSYSMVFSQGMLEHFDDFNPFAKEMCRVSNKYVVLFQPNHFSIFGRMITLLGRRVVKEWTYRISDYADVFRKYGFDLVYSHGYNFNELFALVFVKNQNGKTNNIAQQIN